jgi:hypothetical protein
MNKSPAPCLQRTRAGLHRHSADIVPASDLAEALEAGIWPYLPVCASRALLMALLIFAVASGLAAFPRGAHAQSPEVLLSNGVGLGLTEFNHEDESTLPEWSMAGGFMIRSARFNPALTPLDAPRHEVSHWSSLSVGLLAGFARIRHRGPSPGGLSHDSS